MCNYCDYKSAFDELCDLHSAYLRDEFTTAQFLHHLGILICEYSLSLSENYNLPLARAAMSGNRKEIYECTRKNRRN